LAASRGVIRPIERLTEHHEGVGKLHVNGGPAVPVRYVLDTWLQSIATGSGTQGEMRRSDGFLWWEKSGLQPATATLETEDGRKLNVSLTDIRNNRAAFSCRH
jgi:hypothetical protein